MTSGNIASGFMAIATKATWRISIAVRRWVYAVLAVFGHDRFVRFVVLTRSRTGSNLLLSFLNSHPNILAEGEIFSRLEGADALGRLRAAFGRQPRHIKAKGFKLFYYHPLDSTAEDLWKSLERADEVRIIHLTRRNVLRTLLSRKIAGLKGSWTGTRFDAADSNDKRVTMSADELEDGFRQTRDWERAALVKFGTHPLLEIAYEELVQDPLVTYSKVLKFLDVPPRPPHTGLRQQNPERLRELIRNYDELKVRFSGTPWQSFFEE